MKKLLHVWLMPALAGAISLIGLLVALFGDGLADLFSIAMLSVPTALCLWHGYIRR